MAQTNILREITDIQVRDKNKESDFNWPRQQMKLKHILFFFSPIVKISLLIALQHHQLFLPTLLQSHIVLFGAKTEADSLRKSDVLALIALAKEWIMQ